MAVPSHLACCCLLLSLATLPTSHCRVQKQPGRISGSGSAKLPAAWKITLAVLLPAAILLALGAAACCRKRRGGGKPHPRSVNGGMTRSDSTVAPTTTDDAGAPGADGPGQLGCARGGGGEQETRKDGRPRAGAKVMRAFDYDVLADAAGGFSRSSALELGRSSSGTMVRGTLVSDEGLETSVAIKVFHHKFSERTSQRVSEDLKGQPLRHRNLLCPLGYCLRKGKLYLVYDYMPNGSLDQHLFEERRRGPSEGLSWSRRCSVIKGVAAGLHHLHSHGGVHGAIKASNVLLDRDMTAHLGDFGYSRAVFTVSRKDQPYLAPECWVHGTTVSVEPTSELDVFYLGAVILEVICGRRTCDAGIVTGGTGVRFLVDWVGKLYIDGRIVGAVDEKLAGDFNQAEAEKLLLLGLACSHPDPQKRLKMEDVVKIITGSMAPPALLFKEADNM